MNFARLLAPRFAFFFLLLLHAPSAPGAPSPTPSGRPKFGPEATPLSSDPAYLRGGAAAPDFWALIPYLDGQRTGYACSVASTQMVVNAARAAEGGVAGLRADDGLASHGDLLKRVRNPAWRGWGGSLLKLAPGSIKGVTLDQYGGLLPEAFQAYAMTATVEVVHAAPGPEFAARLKRDLEDNEKSARDFIVANFLQSELTGDPEGGGHVAPVAAFDAVRGRVLILDPDREWYEPYWVSLEAFQRAMATTDSGARKTRGYVRVRWNR